MSTAGFVLVALSLVASMQGDVPIRTIDKGTQSGVDAARTVVARTPEEWTAVWRAHAHGKPAPAVDFSREMIVGVFLGTRPTAGYGVEIAGAREDAGGLVVQYREGSPPRDAITAQVLTMPFHLVAVPKREGEVRFLKMP
jgi:PrcB C-terminal